MQYHVHIIQYDTTYNTMLIAENSTCIHTGHTKIHNTIDMTLYIIQNRVTYTCNTSIYLPHNLGEKESSTPGKYIFIDKYIEQKKSWGGLQQEHWADLNPSPR